MTTERAAELIEFLRRQRQTRVFTSEPVSDDDVGQILEVARWTGSSKNTQPWNFVVVRDKATLEALSKTRKYAVWIADVPMIIAPVMEGDDPMAHGYDEGRVSERIMLAAQALGLGAGVVWFSEPPAMAEARRLLNIPPGHALISAVAVGHPAPADPNAPKRDQPRKPLSDIVHWERFGEQ